MSSVRRGSPASQRPTGEEERGGGREERGGVEGGAGSGWMVGAGVIWRL